MTRPFSAAEAVASFEDDATRPDVWIFDRTRPEFVGLAEIGPNSADERARAGRLAAPADGAHLLARRAALRRVLGLYLARDPEDIRLVTLPGGKPALVPAPDDARRLTFSTGHSGDLFCLAVGTAKSLGVDVEIERDVPRAVAIATRWFSPAEAAPIHVASPESRVETFLRLWTAKEALAKRHSAGLRLLRRGQVELDVGGQLAAGALVHFMPRPGYVGALASTSTIEDVRILSGPRLG